MGTYIKRTRNKHKRTGLKFCPVCGVKLYWGAVDRNKRPDAASVDHIVPKAKGGSSRKENLWIICLKCNKQKGCRGDYPNLALQKRKPFCPVPKRINSWSFAPERPDAIKPPQEYYSKLGVLRSSEHHLSPLDKLARECIKRG